MTNVDRNDIKPGEMAKIEDLIEYVGHVPKDMGRLILDTLEVLYGPMLVAELLAEKCIKHDLCKRCPSDGDCAIRDRVVARMVLMGEPDGRDE